MDREYPAIRLVRTKDNMTRFKSWNEVAEQDGMPDVYHTITWWIEQELTMDQWVELDNKMSDILAEIVGDKFSGYAGPVPFGNE